MKKEKIDLFGLKIDDLSLHGAVSRVLFLLDARRQVVVFTPNLQMLDGARRQEDIREMLSSADLLLPDGSSLLIISRLLGAGLSSLTPGIEFGEELLTAAARRGLRVFLLGGKEGVASLAAKELQKRIAGLCICGTHHGYIENGISDALIEAINTSRADILLVCMGFPRQERFILRHKEALPDVRVFAALGGSLDVWSGKVRRAPRFIRRAHAEWLWRIAREPKRLPSFISSLSTLAVAARQGAKNYCKNFSQSRKGRS